jgi:hypothetical protein
MAELIAENEQLKKQLSQNNTQQVWYVANFQSSTSTNQDQKFTLMK